MKKKVFALLLALCFCLAAGCSAEQALHDITESLKSEPTAEPLPSAETAEQQPTDAQAPAEQPADDSGTDLYMPGEPGFFDDSPSDAQPGGEDYTALTAAECVEDAWPSPGVLPRIVLDCPGADEINAQLQDKFAPIADDPACEGLHYECNKVGQVLTVLMVERWPNDCTYYTPFNLDLASGQTLSGAELLALLGVDAAELANLEQAVMGEEFTHQFGLAEGQQDEDFYTQQYERTTSPDNAETERVWMGGDGQLYFAGRIYGLAGAEYYEYPMGSGLFFG